MGLGSRGGSGNSLMAFNAGLMGLRSAGSASSSSSLAGPPPGAGPAEDAPDSLSLKLHVITFNMADMTPSRSVLQCPACQRSLRCMRPCLESSNNAAKGAPSAIVPNTLSCCAQPGCRLEPELFGAYRNDADIYAIGTQETCAAADWEQLLAEHMPASQYVKVGGGSICLHPSMSR